MSLIFEKATHVYTLDGIAVPSVTGILKSAGLLDFSKIPPFILEAALERGSKVHQAIHFVNERDLDVARFCLDFPGYAPYLLAWIAFCDQRRFTPVLNEHRVASRRHHVAGTLDCLGVLDGVPVLIDFKTGRPDDVAAELQTAAYLGFALEWASEDDALARFFAKHPIVKRYAVQLKKDATFRVEAYAAPTDYREFLALVTARRVVEKRRGAWVDELAEVA
jgi:hypothetical protein